MPIAKNLNIPAGASLRISGLYCRYGLDISEPAHTKITVNLPNTILVDGGELSPQHRSPQSAIRLKFLANS